MNCSEFWKTDPEQASHLDECPRCRAGWETEQQLMAALHAAAPDLRREQAPARVESRLLAAMRAQAGLQFRPRRPLWVNVLTWASAGAAVAVLAVFLVRDHTPAPARQARPLTVELAAIEVQPAPEPIAFVESEFIPLPNAAALEADEEVNLVRMELPRSTMIALGFDVSDEEDSESIAADVAVGTDGLARAVRLVEE